MKSPVPGSEPGILPFVGHGDNVKSVHIFPGRISPTFPFSGWRRLSRIAAQPLLNIVIIKLFGPQHAGKTLPLNVFLVGRHAWSLNLVVIIIRFPEPVSENLIKNRERTLQRVLTHPQLNDFGLSPGNGKLVQGGGLRTLFVRIDTGMILIDDILMKSVLYIRTVVFR